MQASNPFSLADKRILVTGATSGIGHAIALACARMGAEVIGVGRNPERLASAGQALNQISDKPHRMLQADLTNAEERQQLVQSLSSQLNGVVHSAGVSRLCPVRIISQKHLDELQAINVTAPTMLTQALLQKNLIAPGGSIVFISSIAAHAGVAGVAAYSGTKAALLAISRCLSMEVSKHRIRSNCLSPALVETPMFEGTSQVVGSLDKELRSYPLGVGKPEDVANASVFLLSDASRWITGTTIVMGGSGF
ncbi:2-dehydro-3-deoxy-D-gluconate 5-dehydrogenase [Methylophilaceae bacterium]|nr:2-dehydro-3-deoxy-D-gluconate 5-dehydrogenase [Methylophilaceae bacterium]